MSTAGSAPCGDAASAAANRVPSAEVRTRSSAAAPPAMGTRSAGSAGGRASWSKHISRELHSFTVTILSDLLEVTVSDAALRRFLHGLPGVDQVGAEARASMLATRSIKTSAKAWALDRAVSMVDLTTLEGQDTPGKVRALCAKGRRPDPSDPTVPSVAAICVYPDLAGVAAEALEGSGVHVAAVATAFPSGRSSLDVKLADT